jgi:hypothetical protein
MCYSRYVSTLLWPSMSSGHGHQAMGYKPRRSDERSVSPRGHCAGAAALCRARQLLVVLGQTAVARW